MSDVNSVICQAVVLVALVVVSGCGQTDVGGPIPNTTAALDIRKAIAGSSEDGGSAQEAAPTGTGWATLKGRFVFDGTPPTMPPYNVTKDQATCSPGGKSPPQETLVVNSATGGIKNIAVYLRKASRVHESANPSDEEVEFDQKTCVFLSHVLPVTVGQTIQLMNSDPVGHNTNIAGSKNKFNQIIPAGEAIPYVAQNEEAVPAPVNCSIHPWMIAYLLPRKDGYVAVTNEDGSFEIPNLPAGEELEIQVWHESATGPGSALVLSTPEAKELNWSRKGRFNITLEPDSTKEIEFSVPASAFRI